MAEQKAKLQLVEVTLNEDGEHFISESTENPYYVCKFAMTLAGIPVSRKVTRTMWGKLDDDGNAVWDIFSPEQAKQLQGVDLSQAGYRIEASAIEPQEFVGADGNLVTYSQRSFVVFGDETLEQAARRSGSKLPQVDADTDTVEEGANTESIVA